MPLHLLLFLVCLPFVSALPPVISSVSYEIVTSSALGVSMSLGVFQVEFDQPLYFHDIDYCIPGCLPEPTCDPCNYALQGEQCGSVPQQDTVTQRKLDENHTEKESNPIPPCNCTGGQKSFCGGTNKWITVNEGELLTNQVISATPTYYRFHTTQRCSGIRFHINTLVGTVYGSVNWGRGALPTTTLGDINLMQGSPFLVCPRNSFYQPGTAFLSLWSIVASNVTLRVTTFDTQKFEQLPINSDWSCQDDPSKQCVRSGEIGQQTVNALNPVYWRLTITKCQLYLVHHEYSSTINDVPQQNHGLILNQHPVPSPEYFVDSIRPFLVTFCPLEEGVPLIVYACMYSDYSAHWLIVISPYNESMFPQYRTYRIDELPNYLFRALDGILQVNCPTNRYYCAWGCFLFLGCCLDLWTILPVSEITPLYPFPKALQSFDADIFGQILEWKNQSSEGSGRRAAIVTSFEMINGLNTRVSEANWRDVLDSECTIGPYFWSPIMSLNNEIVQSPVSLKGKLKQHSCEYKDFFGVSSAITTLSANLDPTNNLQRFQIDEETFSEPWQGCEAFVLSLMTESWSTPTIANTTSCPLNMIKKDTTRVDSCCNSELNWEQCCVERNIQVNETTLTPSKNLKSSQCQSECLAPLLEDFAFFSNLLHSSRGCSSAIQSDPLLLRKYGFEFYQNCKQQYFGDDGKGKKCFADQECPSQHCDVTRQLCVFETHQEYWNVVNLFFQCFVDKAPASTMLYIVGKYGNESGSQNVDNKEQLLQILRSNFVVNGCLADYGPSARGTYVLYAEISTLCPPCPSVCLDKWCSLPLICEWSRPYGRPGALCTTKSLSLQIQDQEGCEQEKICGWNSSVSADSCSTSTKSYVCVVCESPTDCVPIAGIKSETECLSSRFCVNANGSIRVGLSEDECAQFGACSVDCGGCETQQECESAGRCSDQDLIDHLLAAESIQKVMDSSYSVDTSGYCWSDIKPWNKPDCGPDLGHQFWTPWSLGCLLTQNQSSCSGEWKEMITNREDCEARMSCIEPQIYTQLKTPKDLTQCALCQGTSVPLFSWEPGQWIRGKQMKGQWVAKNQTNTKDYWASSIDFVRLGDLVDEATQSPYYLQLETELYCRLNPTRALLEQISCVCDTTNSSLTESFCLQQSSIDMGVGRACPETFYQLVVPPSILTFYQDSVVGECVDFSVNTLIADQLGNTNQKSISTSFRKIDTNQDPVKNDQGGFVGQLLGNGVTLVGNVGNQIVYYELCVDLPNLNTVWNVDRYPVLDFARRVNSYVVPLGFQTRLEDEVVLCADVNNSVFQISNLEIYPIARETNWESSNSSLSAGELATFIIMCVLYALVVLYGVSNELNRGFKNFKPIRMISIFLISCCLVRAVYFLCLATSAIGNGDTPTIEFIFVEAPTFLYLNGLLVDLVLWAEIGLQAMWGKKSVVYRTIWIFAATSVVVLATVVIVWSVLKESGHYYCGRRLYQAPDTTNQNIVTYVYRAFISLIAVVIAISIFVGSQRAVSVMTKTMTRSFNPNFKSGFLKNIERIGIIASTSLIAQCIFFVSYTAKGNYSYGYAYLLIPLELGPALLLMFLVAWTPMKKERTNSTPSSGSGDKRVTSSAGMSMGVGKSSVSDESDSTRDQI